MTTEKKKIKDTDVVQPEAADSFTEFSDDYQSRHGAIAHQLEVYYGKAQACLLGEDTDEAEDVIFEKYNILAVKAQSFCQMVLEEMRDFWDNRASKRFKKEHPLFEEWMDEVGDAPPAEAEYLDDVEDCDMFISLSMSLEELETT